MIPNRTNVIELEYISNIKIDNSFIYYKRMKSLYKKGDNLHSLVKDKFILVKNGRALFDKYIIDTFCNKYFATNEEKLSYSIPLWENSLYENITENPLSLWFRAKQVDDGIEIYRLVTPNSKQLIKLGNVIDEITWKKIRNFLCYNLKLSDYLEVNGITKAKKDVNALIQNDALIYIDHVANISNNPNEYCHAYIDLEFNDIKNIPTPAFNSFLSQFENKEYKEVFMAWIFSIFVASNKSRQMLYIQGRGKSGKSTIITVITEYLQLINPILVQVLENTKFHEDKYSLSSYGEARFVTLSDCADRFILKRDTVRQLTGGDVIASRSMNFAKITKEIYAKVMVASNYKPYISSMNEHELTRILYVALDDKKVWKSLKAWNHITQGDWKTKIKQELPTFIKKCKPYYHKWLSNDGNNFNAPSMMYNDLEVQAGSDYYHAVNTYFEKHWKIVKKSENTTLDSINEDFIRFMAGYSNNKKNLFKSYVMVYLRENNVEIVKTGKGNTLLVYELERMDYNSTWKQEKENYAKLYQLPQ